MLGVEHQALGLIRQLAADGIPCVLADEDRYGVARFSRYAKRTLRCPRYLSKAFPAWLKQVASQHGLEGWSLIPTHDEQVLQISRHLTDQDFPFRYAGPDRNTFETLYDKRRSHLWAESLGLEPPRSFLPETKRDRPDSEELAYPFLVKPAIKENFKKQTNQKAILVRDEAQLEALLSGTLEPVPAQELIYQELITGRSEHNWSYAGFFVRGEPIAAFTARRTRQHPPDFGRASTFVEAVHDPEVEERSLAALRSLQYTGLAEVEWKRDSATKRLRYLEINARSWGWHSLSEDVVGNLATMVHHYLSGQKLGHIKPTYGGSWVRYLTDLPVGVHLWRTGDLSAREYVASLRARDLQICEWASNDVLPFFLQPLLLPYLLITRGY